MSKYANSLAVYRYPLTKKLESKSFVPFEGSLRIILREEVVVSYETTATTFLQAGCQSNSAEFPTFRLRKGRLPHRFHASGLASSNCNNAKSVHPPAGLLKGTYPIFGETLLSCQFPVSVQHHQIYGKSHICACIISFRKGVYLFHSFLFVVLISFDHVYICLRGVSCS